MRHCYYAPEARNDFAKCVAVLPYLASPLGPRFEAPLSDNSITQDTESSHHFSLTADNSHAIPPSEIISASTRLPSFDDLMCSIQSRPFEGHQSLATASTSYGQSANCSTQRVSAETFDELCLPQSVNVSGNCDYSHLLADTECGTNAQLKSYADIRSVQSTMHGQLVNSSCQPPIMSSEGVYVGEAEQVPCEWEVNVSPPGEKMSSHVLLSQGDDPDIINPPIEKLDWQEEFKFIMDLVNSLAPDEIEDQCSQTIAQSSDTATSRSNVAPSPDSQTHVSIGSPNCLSFSAPQEAPGHGPLSGDSWLTEVSQYFEDTNHSSRVLSERTASFQSAQPAEFIEAEKKAGLKRISDAVETTTPSRRPRFDAPDSEGDASVGIPLDEPFIKPQDLPNQEENHLSFLTQLKNFAQALLKHGQGKSKPVEYRYYYRAYLQLIKESGHRAFNESMLKLYSLFDRAHFSKAFSTEGEASYEPIFRRVKHWSGLGKFSADTNVKTSKRMGFRLDPLVTRPKLKDMIDGLLFFYLYGLSEDGHKLIEDALSPKPLDEQAKAMAKGLHKCSLLLQNAYGITAEVHKEDANVEPLLLCCLIYSIVCKNLDFGYTGYWGARPLSNEFAAHISSKVKECLINQASIQMTNEDVEKLREAYGKLLGSAANDLKSKSSGGEPCKTSFYVERIAALFESEHALSSAVSAAASKRFHLRLLKAIDESRDKQVMDWREEIRELGGLMIELRIARQSGLSDWSSLERDLLSILGRYKAWLDATQSPEHANGIYRILGKSRGRLKDLIAGARFAARALSFPEEVKALESLLSRVSLLIEPRKRSRIREADRKLIQEGLKFKVAQELLMFSLLYSIVSKSLDIEKSDNYDYSLLQEADIKAVRRQAEAYLNKLQNHMEIGEDDLKLPPTERANLFARLTSSTEYADV